MTFEVTILGSNSALPAHGRHPTSQVLNHNEKLYLLDCGEGTQIQMTNFRIKRSKIDHIFISHMHGDHYYGLIGLLTSYHLLKRTEPLHLFGPKGLKEIIDLNFRYSDTHLAFNVVSHEVDCASAQMIYENDQLTVTSIPMKHRIPCCGFLFQEKKRERRILAEQLTKHNIPVAMIADLKKGKDLELNDQIISNYELTADPPLSRSYAFCSDTLFTDQFIEQVKATDLLYHEATFMDESKERAALTFHSTTLQAATTAKQAAVKKLLIGHFSAKYDDLQLLLEEAKSIFPNTQLAIEGASISVGE